MTENRRPVASRQVNAFQVLAKKLVTSGITPNQVSVMSCVFSLFGGWTLSQLANHGGIGFYVFSLCSFFAIQLRLLCNLVDGLMAVEGGLKTPTGELFNDVPDRFSDLFLIVGAALSVHEAWLLNLGWAAASMALMTAYVRTLGASLGQGHDFKGPMAKQHRMAVLTVALIAAFLEHTFNNSIRFSMGSGIGIIFAGSVLTIFARLSRLVKKINAAK